LPSLSLKEAGASAFNAGERDSFVITMPFISLQAWWLTHS
jgi:hypothetical protein